MNKRLSLMKQYAAQAKEYDRRGDVVLRTQAANNWHEQATAAEVAKAPRYLTWIGRK